MQELKEKLEVNLRVQAKLLDQIESFAGATLTRNARKLRHKAVMKLDAMKKDYSKLLEEMEAAGRLTKEEFVVLDVVPYRICGPNGIIKYVTQYEAIDNEPAAFLRNPGTLRRFGLFKDKSDDEIREILYKQQLNNDKIREERRKRGEEEEEEEDESEAEKNDEEIRKETINKYSTKN